MGLNDKTKEEEFQLDHLGLRICSPKKKKGRRKLEQQ